jgi:PilZ domain
MPAPIAPSDDGTHWFNKHKVKVFADNRRLGVRYIRDDIFVSLHKLNFLNLDIKAFREETFVKLLDISSKGASVATDLKLNVNNKVLLTIAFMGSKSFTIQGKVVRVSMAKRPVYGIKFDQVNTRMAEFLITSQKKLTFK